MLPLSITENKQAIRQNWDKLIIEKFCRAVKMPRLNYFGLPGPDIRDFHDWSQHLNWKTGVEFLSSGKGREEQLRNINRLQTNVMLGGYSDNWDLRRGSLEDIILDGVDVDGKRPALLIIEKGRPPQMIYDLHNWDFQGGLGYQKVVKGTLRKEAKRIEAIKQCVRLQKGHPFLFFLTLNVRHTLGDEPSKYLVGTGKEIFSDKHKKILQWYSQRSTHDHADHYRTKATVPLLIRQVAHVNSFDCFCYPPIYYEGWKEHLLHFVFSLIPMNTALPAFSKQNITQVIELPLIEAQNGKFVIPEQHPGLTQSQVVGIMSRLGLPLK